MLQHRIFISSSSDLRPEREEIASHLRDWLRERGLSDIVSPYLWEEATEGGNTLDDRMSAQEQIPDPAGDDVLLVVTMFGERCGVPLADDFRPDMVERLSNWRAQAGKGGFLVPWPRTGTAEYQEALQGEHFPLTGTVFEMLSACTGSSGRLITAYVADRDVEADTAAGGIVLNERRLYKAQTDRKTDDEISEYNNTRYRPQVSALLNVIKRRNADGSPPRRFNSPGEMISWLKQQCTRHLEEKLGELGVTSETARNPFPGLRPLDMSDPGRLPGFADLAAEMAAELMEDLNRRQGQPVRVLLATGPSGCGKTSFLRKGVLPALLNHKEAKLSHLVVRPADLGNASSEARPLDLLIDELERAGGATGKAPLVLPKSVHEKARRPDGEAPLVLAGAIEELLASRDSGNRRHVLVLLLDQFEEIIDRLANGESDWWELIRFVEALHQGGRLVVLATLESLRRDALETLKLSSMWRSGNAIHCNIDAEIGAGNRLRRLISEPFNAARLPLDERIVGILEKEFQDYREHKAMAQKASPLPLLSLCLQRLFDRFSHRIGRSNPASMARKFDDASVLNAITLEDLGMQRDGETIADLTFGGIINDLANAAWHEGGGEFIEDEEAPRSPFKVPDINDFDGFFMPLVAASAHDGEIAFRLTSAPRDTGFVSRDDLTEAFLRHRLLVNDKTPKRVRIVHQAVLDHWEPGRKWLETRSDYLADEDRMHADAEAWARNGFDPSRLPRDAESIRRAGTILSANVQVWSQMGGEYVSAYQRYLVRYARGVFANSKTPEGTIALPYKPGDTRRHVHIAAGHGMLSLLQQFLHDAPECVNLKTENGLTPLGNAAWSQPGAVAIILESEFGALTARHPDEDAWQPITAAINSGKIECFELLRVNHEDVNDPVGPLDFTMLHLAARWARPGIVKRLLELEAKTDVPDAGGLKPLHMAALSGCKESFRLIFEATPGEIVGDQLELAMNFASMNGHHDIVSEVFRSLAASRIKLRDLLSAINQDGLTPLGIACLNKHAQVVRQLSAHENPVPVMREGSYKGSTPLHLAMTPKDLPYERRSERPSLEEERRVVECVQALLYDENGDPRPVDPNAIDGEGRRAEVVGIHYPEAVELIRNHPGYSWSPDQMTDGDLAAHLQSSSSRIVAELLEQSPELLARRFGSNSGIELVLGAGHFKLVSDFLESGTIDPCRNRMLALNLMDCPPLRERGSRVLLGGLRQKLEQADESCDRVAISALLAALYQFGIWQESERTSVIGELVRRIADPQAAATSDGHTLLHKIARNDDPGTFRACMATRPERIMKDNWGRLPSDLCASAVRDDFLQMEREAIAHD